MPPVPPPDVATAMDRLSPEARPAIDAMRAMIFEVAEDLGVGPLTETLKWGEPAYLTAASRAGTTIRLGARGGRAALFFHCQTPLVEEARMAFPDHFDFEGNRAVILKGDVPQSDAALRHCIARALTYHRQKRAPSHHEGLPHEP